MKEGSIVQEPRASQSSEDSALSVDVFECSNRQWGRRILSVQELLDVSGQAEYYELPKTCLSELQRQELPELLLA
jgi:hypothetical protein